MEKMGETSNPYILSKIQFGHFVSNFIQNGGKVSHFQLHTLFGGGVPKPFMFLGKIYSSLLSNKVFHMTSGNQIREYHHVDDDVFAMRLFLEQGKCGIIDLSHGQPLKLRHLAENIFSAFNRTYLLKIGSLDEPQTDNYELFFSASPFLEGKVFRSQPKDVIAHLQSHL